MLEVNEAGAALTSLQLIDDVIKTDDAAFTPATDKVAMVGAQADMTSPDQVNEGDAGALRMSLLRELLVQIRDAAGNDRGLNIDASGNLTANLASGTTVGVTPSTSGGLSIFRSIDLDETEEDVKTSPGQLYGIWFSNTATSTRFLKIYNDTAANVTVGSSTPVITLALPGNSSDDVSGQLSAGGQGITFSTAICVAATTGVADNDTGAPGNNEVLVNVFYK